MPTQTSQDVRYTKNRTDQNKTYSYNSYVLVKIEGSFSCSVVQIYDAKNLKQDKCRQLRGPSY